MSRRGKYIANDYKYKRIISERNYERKCDALLLEYWIKTYFSDISDTQGFVALYETCT